MNYALMPSLEHMALVKIATALWNQRDNRALIDGFYFSLPRSKRREMWEKYYSFLRSKRKKMWQRIENKVMKKVPQLQQPRLLRYKIAGLIKPIGLQILKWMEYHLDTLDFVITLPNEFCWTPQGTVDNKKTAEVLIRYEKLDIAKRYILACIYCLKDDIRGLWNRIPENRKESFYSEEDPRKVRQPELVVLWTYDIKGEVAKMDNVIDQSKCSPYKYAFEYAASAGNKVATQYFLQLLTPREREESLVRFAGFAANRRFHSASDRTDYPKAYYVDILCFLLSQMNEEQQMEVFESYAFEVLICFLDWPWQSLFMETANRMWDFLSDDDYGCLLRIIVNKVIDGYKDCNYQKIFEQFWHQSHNAHKRYVLGETIVLLLSKLFKIKDKKNISLILQYATLEEKERIIFHEGKDTCESLICSDEWDLLKFFIQECISSKEVTIKFKEEFRKHIIQCHSEEELEKEGDMWSKFFQLLDNLIHNDDKKRNMEEGDSSPAKKLRSIEFEEILCSVKKSQREEVKQDI